MTNCSGQIAARQLSLAHLTVIDADPFELIAAAKEGGFDAIGLRIFQPPGAAPVTPLAEDALLRRRFKGALEQSAVSLLDVEAVWLQPETEVPSLIAGLDAAAEFNARAVVVTGNDPERQRLVSNFGALSAAANERGLRVMLEFLPYAAIRSLSQAHDLLIEVSPADAGLLVDALHLSRSGGHPSDLRQYDSALFDCGHLCDAPAALPTASELRAEARSGRLYPGEGELWLDEFLRAFPPDASMAVEAPSSRHADLSLIERARLAGRAARALIDRIDRETEAG